MNDTALIRQYDGLVISFTDDGWFNATQAAAHHGKRPIDWLKTDEATNYIAAMAGFLGIETKVTPAHFGLVRTQRGGNGAGTWLHPKLAVRFAQWLDIRFGVWCDLQIDAIVRDLGAGSGCAAEYLPSYHDLHDRAHELAAGSANEKFVHMNLNKLVNRTVGIEPGTRGELPIGKRSMVAVAQFIAVNALTGAADHHDGYANAKTALSKFQAVLLPPSTGQPSLPNRRGASSLDPADASVTQKPHS